MLRVNIGRNPGDPVLDERDEAAVMLRCNRVNMVATLRSIVG